jgi:hypothetical protein
MKFIEMFAKDKPNIHAFKSLKLGFIQNMRYEIYRGADKSLARPGRKQATATEDFEYHISYL